MTQEPVITETQLPAALTGASPHLDKLFEALAHAQAQMQPAMKDRAVDFATKSDSPGGGGRMKYSYATLAGVWDTCRLPLSGNGLAVTQQFSQENERFITVVSILGHTSGQFITSELTLPCGSSPQSVGSAISYARRYTLMALVGVVTDEDDDGHGANEGRNSKGPERGENAPPFPAKTGQQAPAAKPAAAPVAPPPPPAETKWRITDLGRRIPETIVAKNAGEFWAYVSKYLPMYCDNLDTPQIPEVAKALAKANPPIKVISDARTWPFLVDQQYAADEAHLKAKQEAIMAGGPPPGPAPEQPSLLTEMTAAIEEQGGQAPWDEGAPA